MIATTAMAVIIWSARGVRSNLKYMALTRLQTTKRYRYLVPSGALGDNQRTLRGIA